MPVLPVYIHGLGNDLKKQVLGNFTRKGDRVNVVFGRPVDLESFYDQARPRVFKAVSEHVMAAVGELAEKREPSALGKHAWVVFTVCIACGGAIAGTLGGDGGPTGDAGPTCTTSSTCPSGETCGFDETVPCSSAGAGHCFPTGAVCNSFSPGCACDGMTINIACTGLPNGYSTAPLSHTGTCGTESGVAQFPCGSTDCFSGSQVCSNGTTCVPAGGCTTCACAQTLFQCVSTCKQLNQAIYVQCQ